MTRPLKITYIGGPTALLEFGGLRLLTDPTFDPAGSEYPSGPNVLKKLAGPAVALEALGRVDAVLLSHDHHSDNFDNAGRKFASQVPRVITTTAGAERLGGNATGLSVWQSTELHSSSGRVLKITATPARHGPANMDRGPVIGFVLAFADAPEEAIYISGDTVWYEGVAEVAKRFSVRNALLFMGAAQVASVGAHPLTMTAVDGVEVAHAFPQATIVPLHYEGWAHFTESRAQIMPVVAAAGIDARVRWLKPGVETVL